MSIGQKKTGLDICQSCYNTITYCGIYIHIYKPIVSAIPDSPPAKDKSLIFGVSKLNACKLSKDNCTPLFVAIIELTSSKIEVQVSPNFLINSE